MYLETIMEKFDALKMKIKNFFQKDVMISIENELSGFLRMKTRFQAHIEAADIQFKESEAEIIKKKSELENKMREIEIKIEAEKSKQQLLVAAKKKATAIIGNIESFMGETN